MSKNFGDFLSSIDEKTIEKIVGQGERIEFTIDNNGMQKYTETILSHSFTNALNLLELYHNWLLENYDIKPKAPKD